MVEQLLMSLTGWFGSVSGAMTAAGLAYALKQAYLGHKQTHDNSELIQELQNDIKTVKQRVNQLEDHHNVKS